MEFVFLSSDQPITKSFEQLPDGSITKSSYPSCYQFSTHAETVSSLKDLLPILRKHAAIGNCLLKGKVNKQLVNEPRAGATTTNDTTEWVCLDVDGVDRSDIDAFLAELNLGDVSYIVQYSASSLIGDNKLRCHIFMQLDKSYPAPLLKQWLIDLNHSTPVLTGSMELTKTDSSIRWPLDVSVCQNDKLIYIAAPVLKKIKDPHGVKNPRIAYVKKKKAKLTLDKTIPNVTVNQQRTDARINELREAKGIPARKYNYRIEDGLQVLAKPDQVSAYEIRYDRGFVYFNLNGGDSWGYYHPDNNPKYIRNFKSEPVYLTKELLPEYWDELEKAKTEKLQNDPIEIKQNGLTYLAFSDRRTSAYWKGTYDAATNRLDIHPARSARHVIDFIKAHGLPNKDFIPEWDVIFDPQDPIRVDPANRIINLFEPTVYMIPPFKKIKAIPKTIHRVIDHALGNDPASFKQFINWCTYIAQYRTLTKTAWVIHGAEGTGKGVMFHHILKPLFGDHHSTMRSISELNSTFNGYVKNKLIICIDECETKSLTNESGALADLRNLITEPTIQIAEKYQVATSAANHSNWLFFSNKPNAISIPKNDRRFNVAKYQPAKLVISDADIDAIADELSDFYHYLLGVEVDLKAVVTPMINEAKEEMASIASSSDAVADALLEGDFGFFVGLMPSDDSYHTNALQANKVMAYENVLINIMTRTAQPAANQTDKDACNISRDELMKLFTYAVGGVPDSPHKFTTMLRHKRIITKKCRVDGKNVYGMTVKWKDFDNWDEYRETLLPNTPAAVTKLKVVKK